MNRLISFKEILRVLFILNLFFLVRSCDYWSPPIESEMIDRGGAYKIWWSDDGSPYYEITFFQIDTTYTLIVDKAKTFVLRRVTFFVDLFSLNKNKKRKGFDSFWSPPSPKITKYIYLFPLKKNQNEPFGMTFDSTGKALNITLNDVSLLNRLCFFVDSSMKNLITPTDSSSQFSSIYDVYIIECDSLYPYDKGIAPPPDIQNYSTRAEIDTTYYWLWIDKDKNGYSEDDNFVLIHIGSIDTLSNYIILYTYYQTEGGLRWVWEKD